MDIVLEHLTSKQFITSVALVIVAFVITRAISHAYKLYAEKTDRDIKTYAFVKSVIRTVKLAVWFLALLTVLEVNEINITSIVAGVGVAGAIFGLAMQDIFKDVIMGIHIVNNHSFQVGDMIRINGDEGIVTMFTLQSTQYRNFITDDLVTICNREITSVAIAGTTYYVDVNISYSEDQERMEEIFAGCAERLSKHKNIKKADSLGLSGFGESSATYSLMLHCKAKEHYAVERAAYAELLKTFKEENIKIAFNKLDVNMRPFS